MNIALRENRKATFDNPEARLNYGQCLCTHATTCGSKFGWDSFATPDIFIIITYNNPDNWKDIKCKLIATEERVKDFLTPIIEEYIADWKEYYRKEQD